MKKLTALLIASAITASTSFATSFSLNGTGVFNAPSLQGYNIGDKGIWVVNGGGGGAFSEAAFAALSSGLSFTVGQSLGGYEIAGVSSVSGNPSTSFRILGGPGSIDVTASAGDGFGVIVFDNSTTATVAGDTYTIYSDSSWVLPAAGASITFGGTDQPARLATGGTTVPEPSAYALLGGLFALTCVMLRRRA